MLALLSGLGIKDIFYGVLITVALSWGGWTYHKYEAAVTYANNAKTESAQIQAAAKVANDAKDKSYATTLAAIQESSDAQIKVATARGDSIADRLRKYQATRCPNSVLGSAAPATAGTAPSAGSSGSTGSGSDQVGNVKIAADIKAVIVAAAHDNDIVTAERAERDAITGK
jgi:uncharacterized iron-regulated membrane protein